MPKLFGLGLVGVLVATAIFWLFGFLWYGVLFSNAWMEASSLTKADFAGTSPAWMGLGVVISFLSVIVIGQVLKWTDTTSIGQAVMRTLVLWAGFGLTMAMYTLAYQPEHSLVLFLIDAIYPLIGWLLAAVILIKLK